MRYLTPVISYFRSSKEELEKVAWPTKQDTIRYSSIVVAVSVAAAVIFASLDTGLFKLVSAIVSSRAPIEATVPAAGESPITIPTDSLQVEGVDANGQPTDIKVTPQPVETTPTN